MRSGLVDATVWTTRGLPRKEKAYDLVCCLMVNSHTIRQCLGVINGFLTHPVQGIQSKQRINHVQRGFKLNQRDPHCAIQKVPAMTMHKRCFRCRHLAGGDMSIICFKSISSHIEMGIGAYYCMHFSRLSKTIVCTIANAEPPMARN